MPIGDSGRIVLEIDPGEKQSLYAALAKDGLTLKGWFLRHVGTYLKEGGQLSLFASRIVAETPGKSPLPLPSRRPVHYSAKPNRKKKGRP
jgi:hypothetical protein